MRLYFLAAALFFSSCAHSRTHIAPAFGFYGVQCDTLKVVCLTSDKFTVAQCLDTVRPAVQQINDAVGRKLLVFEDPRPFTVEAANEAWRTHEHAVFAAPMSNPNHLAETARVRLGYPDPACISASKTALWPDVWAHPLYGPLAPGLVLHELLHALGANHTDEGGAYLSVETSYIGAPTYAPVLTPADAAALRAAYP